MYHTYILFSKCLNKYYVGFSGDDMIVRLRKHNSNHKGFTGGIDDWEIVYLETYLNENDARKRETQIKKWKSRVLIESS